MVRGWQTVYGVGGLLMSPTIQALLAEEDPTLELALCQQKKDPETPDSDVLVLDVLL